VAAQERAVSVSLSEGGLCLQPVGSAGTCRGLRAAPAERPGGRSVQPRLASGAFREALCRSARPAPRRSAVAVDVGEARRSKSQKGLDEALRAGPAPKVSMAMGEAVAGVAGAPGGTWPASISPREGPRIEALGAPPGLYGRRSPRAHGFLARFGRM